MSDPTVHVDPTARIGEGVTIGPFTVIHAGVVIGAGTSIGSHCVLGHRGPAAGDELHIGPGSVVRSHSVLYAGSRYGARLETGHHVTLREGLETGENLRVGTASDLQGDAQIGDYVRCHSNVFVAKGSTLGDFAWLLPYVVLTDDPHPPSSITSGPTIGRYAVVAARSVVLPGISVGEGALVGAGSVVTRDVAAGMLVVGSPARAVKPVGEIPLSGSPGSSAYPWRAHFHRGYPDDVVEGWVRGRAG